MPVPRISVVVPFYNNEDLLGECLKSIAAQSFTDIEVLMVDDGSTDGSAEIAAAQAAADARFRLVQVPHGGSPGYTRNQGIKQAVGEYLSFVDADDTLPPHALEHMLHTLEKSGSDFVTGGVLRTGPNGVTPSVMHARAIKTRQIGTHISRNADLFFDVSVWNKLYRKSFWDAHQLLFPEGVVWEDLQLITKAHVLARAVDIIPEPIYYWRERGKGALSITQSRTSIKNFRDRITALLAIDEFLRQHKPDRLVAEHQYKSLFNDLWLYVPDLGRTSAEYQAEFLELTGSYLAQVEEGVLRKLPSTHKLAYHLIARKMLPELLEYVGYLNAQPVKTVQVVREHGRIRADLPFRKRRDLDIPASVYATQMRELDPAIKVESITWEDGKLVIAGCAYVPSVDIRKRRHTSKIVVLRPLTKGRLPIVVPARSFLHAEAKTYSAQERYDYDWAGFRAVISPHWFRPLGRWQTGDWDAFVLVRARGVWRPARLHSPIPGSAERPAARQVAPGIRLGARWMGKRLHIQVVQTPAELASCSFADGQLAVEVDVRLPAGQSSAELVLAAPRGATTRPIATTVVPQADGTGAGRVRLRGIVPAELIAGRGEPARGEAAQYGAAEDPAAQDGAARDAAVQDGAAEDPAVQVPATRDGAGQDEVAQDGSARGPERDAGAEWDLCVLPGAGERLRVAFGSASTESRFQVGREEIAVEQTRYGNVMIVRRALRPVIDEHAWSDDGTLTLRGTYADLPGQELEAMLYRRAATEVQVLPVQREGDRFVLQVPAAAMPVFGARQPLRDGIWTIRMRAAGQPGTEPVLPVYDHARLAEVTDRKLQFGHKTYVFSTTEYDLPMLVVAPVLGLAEQGRIQRKVLRDMYYPLQQRRQVRDSVVFVSFKGKSCNDNPLGISQELRRRGDDREHIWVVNDWSVQVPDGGRPVLMNTEAYWDALARSRYIISNDDMPARFEKRPGQMYVQTWHGTLLKRIGFDVENPQFISGTKYNEHLARDVAKWDLALSPNPFSTPHMRRAFRYDGEILESGYPRNDVLCSGDTTALAATVRARLGLAPGKKVVMYAPTWRDNQYYASGRYRFDFRLDLQDAYRRLGDDYVFLVRGHHQMADDVPDDIQPGFMLNVTAYPDLSELFLVTDALVTDYSSMMCDFAPTGKPMVFYTYDLEDYRDNLRGFNVDFEAEVPGPMLATSAEVVTALGDLDKLTEQNRARYEAFVTKFCPLDDGKAGARACDRIFGS
jgi:CDP-glycerol glycerophosphotransferase